MLNRLDSQTDETLIAIYVAWVLTLDHRDEAHLRACRSTLKQFAVYLGGVGLLNATESLMGRFVARARGGQRQTPDPDAVAADATVLQDFYQWCCEESWTDKNLAWAVCDPKIPHHVSTDYAHDESGESGLQAQTERRPQAEAE